jgi:hypothetical protein
MKPKDTSCLNTTNKLSSQIPADVMRVRLNATGMRLLGSIFALPVEFTRPDESLPERHHIDLSI